jgi:MFS family permease
MSLTLLVLIFICGAARQCIPVLFPEISRDLNFNLVSIGLIWGIDPLAGVLVGIPGGLLADRFGIKRSMVMVCIIAGVFCALRGLSTDFSTMAITVFLYGMFAALAMTLSPKVTAIWFQGQYLGLTNALIWVFLYIGQMIGSMFSATLLSPWLGGWRDVMFFYSIPCIIIGILWALTKIPVRTDQTEKAGSGKGEGFREVLLHVLRIRGVWIVAIVFMGQMGALSASNGYLPTYLREIGWSIAASDGALTLTLGFACVATIPLVLLSNKLRAPRLFLIAGVIVSGIGFISLFFLKGMEIWAVLAITGLVRAVPVVILNTILIETEGIGSKYAGTAFGVVTGAGMLAAFILPPVGNSFASIDLAMPFVFWGFISLASLSALLFLRKPEGKPS